ncbi:MAG: POTRA domain-containing protein [Terriglobales bacterium]|jgi:outer membrane protein assembly factor BamA
MSRVTCFALLLCLFVSAAAQKSSTSKPSSVSDYKLIALKATGTTRYTDKEILAATGLQIGQNAAEGDFKEAVQRLGESGLFSEVAYTYSYSSAGTKLELQLADTDSSKLVPAHFENFVWFTDDELRTLLQSRVPLFKQLLPIAGSLPDRVSEALQAILTEKHFPGRVDYLREGDMSGGALHGIDYRVEEVSIRISRVEFPGASPEQTALLATAAGRLTGAEYSRAALAATAKFDLLPIYLQRGYLKAAFGPSDARVLPQPSPDANAEGPADLQSDLQVDAIVPVMPGKIYTASGVDWKGNSAIPTSDLTPLLHQPTGQPADAVRLLDDLKTATKLYRSRGYMMVQIKPDAQFDDDKSTVHYVLNVVEGDLYKMGELEILGLDTQATARMREAWALREGQPYNADYLKKYLHDSGQFLPRGVHWAMTMHETPEVKDKTVDVEIHFRQQ